MEAASRLSSDEYQKLLTGNEDKKKKTLALGSYSEAEAKDGYQRATAQHKDGYSDALTKKG